MSYTRGGSNSRVNLRLKEKEIIAGLRKERSEEEAAKTNARLEAAYKAAEKARLLKDSKPEEKVRDERPQVGKGGESDIEKAIRLSLLDEQERQRKVQERADHALALSIQAADADAPPRYSR